MSSQQIKELKKNIKELEKTLESFKLYESIVDEYSGHIHNKYICKTGNQKNKKKIDVDKEINDCYEGGCAKWNFIPFLKLIKMKEEERSEMKEQFNNLIDLIKTADTKKKIKLLQNLEKID